ISNKEQGMSNDEVEASSIALPGAHTTANLLFSFAYPQALNKKFMIFSAIEDAVVNIEIDLGVLIHENRFTYQQKGLHKVMDLGEYWEQNTQSPIPLGGIVMNRQFDIELINIIKSLLRDRIEYSRAPYPLLSDFVTQHS